MNANAIFDEIRKVIPSAAITPDMPALSKRNSLEKAKDKICRKALESLENSASANRDKIYKQEASTGAYVIGLKYGNRWLKDLFGQDQSYIQVATKEDKDAVINELVSRVKDGKFDTQINSALKEFVKLRAKI